MEAKSEMGENGSGNGITFMCGWWMRWKTCNHISLNERWSVVTWKWKWNVKDDDAFACNEAKTNSWERTCHFSEVEKTNKQAQNTKHKRNNLPSKITQTCQDAMHFKAQIRNWDLGKNQKHENEKNLCYQGMCFRQKLIPSPHPGNFRKPFLWLSHKINVSVLIICLISTLM